MKFINSEFDIEESDFVVIRKKLAQCEEDKISDFPQCKGNCIYCEYGLERNMMNTIFKEYLFLKTKEEYINDEMKVIAMVDWHIANTYPDYRDLENREEIEKCVINFLIKNNLKYGGWQHQGSICGAPLIKYKGIVYGFALSCGYWGEIMVSAWDKDNDDKYAYVKFKFSIEDEEEITDKIESLKFNI